MDYIIINRKETGKRIKEQRENKHLTREKLAELLAVETGRSTTPVSIWKWETGRCDISEDYARALCEIFGCRLCELVVVSLSFYDDERDQLVPFIQTYQNLPFVIASLIYSLIIFLIVISKFIASTSKFLSAKKRHRHLLLFPHQLPCHDHMYVDLSMRFSDCRKMSANTVNARVTAILT